MTPDEIALGQKIPGAQSLRPTKKLDNVECVHHGSQYTPGQVVCDGKAYAICFQCFDDTIDANLTEVKEPLVADVYCSQGHCHEIAGDNYCSMCEKRYCTKHMYVAGHCGTCVVCMEVETDTSGLSFRRVESLEDVPCAEGGMCTYAGLFYCEMCRRYFCKYHISSQKDGLCLDCSGERDEDGAD